MYGLNPFAPDAGIGVDPIELQKIRGLLGGAFGQQPMAAQLMASPPQMAPPAPPPPPMMAQPGMTPGRQMLPDMPVGRAPQPQMAPPAPAPAPAPPPQSAPSLPSLVGQPLPNMGPESATPEQRQMEASSAGKPQDVRPNEPIGFDSGLDKMMTDPLFNMGIALLANPKNIGQGLASGLQNWTTAKRQSKQDKLAEEAAKRKNIHWFMRPDGTLAGVNADNPTELITPPGQTPKSTEGKILQPGEGGVPQGFVGVQNPNGNIELHPMPQSQEQKLDTIKQQKAIEEQSKIDVQTAAADAKQKAKMAADREKAQQTFQDIAPVYDRALAAYERASKAGAIGPFASSDLMRKPAALVGTEAESARQEYEKALAELKLRKAQEFLRGQGAVSMGERTLIGDLFPGLNASDPEAGLKFLRYQRDLAKRRASGDWSPFEPQATGSVEAGGGVKTISDKAAFDALPSGSVFIGPDGKTRRKP